MFASAQADKSHARAVSEAIRKALAGAQSSQAKPSETKSADAKPQPPDLTEAMQVLDKSLHRDIEQGNIRLSMEQRGLVISLEAGAFFSSATDNIPPSAYDAVGKVAEVLNQLPNHVRLEGHTDSLPISNSRFQSNWELSAGRSIAMLRILCERFAVDSRRLAIVGYADNEALDSNATEQGRERNRRVDIVITNTSEP